MTVVTPEKITVPESVRRKAGIKTGDPLDVEFVVPSRGTITILVKRGIKKGGYTPAERRVADRDDGTMLTPEEAKKVRHAMKQVRQGKTIPWSQVKHELGL